MRYYQDLSTYSQPSHGITKPVLNMGWLSSEHSFPTGGVSESFLDKLWEFCKLDFFAKRSLPECRLCTNKTWTIDTIQFRSLKTFQEFISSQPAELQVHIKEERSTLAAKHRGKLREILNGETFVFHPNGKIFSAPNMLFHYIQAHNYLPHPEFIEAIEEGPQPNTEEYEALLTQAGITGSPLGSLKSQTAFLESGVIKRPYYEDLTSYSHHNSTKHGNPLNIGWLHHAMPHPKGQTSEEFLNRLWFFTRALAVRSDDLCCGLCALGDASELLEIHQGKGMLLGKGELRIFGKEHVYACPDSLFHYVKGHNYLPPNGFIEAVMTGPPPDTAEYQKRCRDIGIEDTIQIQESEQ